jgi:pyrroloquinoline-quinone synthase
MSITVEPKLLAHPWYRKWECGELSNESLRTYAGEYYWQVAAFPRYLSRLHSQMDDLKQRQVILSNLLDEENQKSPHAELWLDFAEALGLDRDAVKMGTAGAAVSSLIKEFQTLVASSPEEGLGAILAYESQVPEIAHFKKEALERHYMSDAVAEKGTRFFAVHEEADVWHTRELEDLIATLSDDQKRKAQDAAHRACAALWNFLDAMPH